MQWSRLGILLSLRDSLTQSGLQCVCRRRKAAEGRATPLRTTDTCACWRQAAPFGPDVRISQCSVTRLHSTATSDNNASKTTWLHSLHLDTDSRMMRTPHFLAPEAWSECLTALAPSRPFLEFSRAFHSYYALRSACFLLPYRGKMSPKNYYC